MTEVVLTGSRNHCIFALLTICYELYMNMSYVLQFKVALVTRILKFFGKIVPSLKCWKLLLSAFHNCHDRSYFSSFLVTKLNITSSVKD